MLLSPDASLCEKNQAIVVSRDKGKVEHRAINPQGQFDLRHKTVRSWRAKVQRRVEGICIFLSDCMY